jgi:hypothetical protein
MNVIGHTGKKLFELNQNGIFGLVLGHVGPPAEYEREKRCSGLLMDFIRAHHHIVLKSRPETSPCLLFSGLRKNRT